MTRFRATFVLLATAAATLFCAPPAADGAAVPWVNTGAVGTARNQHTATLLQNGKILVAPRLALGMTDLCVCSDST